MTPERLATIRRHVASCTEPREMAGLWWGLQQQGEVTAEVLAEIRTTARGHGWWPLAGASIDEESPAGHGSVGGASRRQVHGG